LTMANRDSCDVCGSATWSEGHLMEDGRLLCLDCWQGRRPAVAMPPTLAQKRQLDLWCAPQGEGGRP
jgi:recombinational DNA repair protein (RecF pathway)